MSLDELTQSLSLTWSGGLPSFCEQRLQYYSKMGGRWMEIPQPTKTEVSMWLKYGYSVRLNPIQ